MLIRHEYLWFLEISKKIQVFYSVFDLLRDLILYPDSPDLVDLAASNNCYL